MPYTQYIRVRGGGGFQTIDLYDVSYNAKLLQSVQLMALQGPYFDYLIACNWLTQRATCHKACHVRSTEISQASTQVQRAPKGDVLELRQNF